MAGSAASSVCVRTTRPLGCGSCSSTPGRRGHRLGARLVEECLAFARAAGYRRRVLWTNDPRAAAPKIYRDAGFELVAEEPHHSDGVDLVGQTYARDL